MERKFNGKKIHLLLLGRTVSRFGASFFQIAIPLYILDATGNLAQSGLFFALSSFPPLLIMPFLGAFIEKWNRKRTVIFCDFMTGGLFLFLAILYGNDAFYTYVLFLAVIMINIFANVFDVSSKLLFSELLSECLIEKYNGLKSVLDNLAAIAGPALGTIVLSCYGFRVLLVIGVAAYFISAVQECFIEYDYKKQINTLNPDQKNWRKEFISGLKFLKNKKSILKVFLLAMSLNFFVANADEIINPGIVIQKYKITESLYGLTSSAAVFGSLAAGIYIFFKEKAGIGRHKTNFSGISGEKEFEVRLHTLFLLNSSVMILVGLLSLFMVQIPRFFFSLFLFLQFVIGGVTAFVNVPLISYFQIQVPIGYQGRFFSLLSTAAGLLIPLGIAYAGCLASEVGADLAYIINNVCVCIVVLICRRASGKRAAESTQRRT